MREQHVRYSGTTTGRGEEEAGPGRTTCKVKCCWHGSAATPHAWRARAICFLHHRLRTLDSLPKGEDYDHWSSETVMVCGICGRRRCREARHAERRLAAKRKPTLAAKACKIHTEQAAAACECALRAALATWQDGADYAEYTPLEGLQGVGTADPGFGPGEPTEAEPAPAPAAEPGTPSDSGDEDEPELAAGPATAPVRSTSLLEHEVELDRLDEGEPVEPFHRPEGPGPESVNRINVPSWAGLCISHSPWALSAASVGDMPSGFQLPSVATAEGLLCPDVLAVVQVRRPRARLAPHWRPRGGILTVSLGGYPRYSGGNPAVGTGLLRLWSRWQDEGDPEIVAAKWDGVDTPPRLNAGIQTVPSSTLPCQDGRNWIFASLCTRLTPWQIVRDELMVDQPEVAMASTALAVAAAAFLQEGDRESAKAVLRQSSGIVELAACDLLRALGRNPPAPHDCPT